MSALKNRIIACTLAAMMIIGICPLTAMAADGIKVTSIRLTVTADVTAGMSYDDIGSNCVTIETITEGVAIDNASIEAVSSSQKQIKVGDEVKVRVELSAKSGYYFRSPSIRVSGATYKSKANSYEDGCTVTFALKPVRGQYDPPEDIDWSERNSNYGKAQWKNPDNGTGYYDLTLYRNDKSVYTITEYYGTSFNFYPWMTKEGDYYFKIRTVPHTEQEKSYGKKSEYEESGSQYISEAHVSDGSGQNNPQGSGGTVGWVHQNNIWYFYYPDGTLKRNGWEKINGKWYLFNSSGQMLTGWQTTGNQTYYLDAVNGDMKTGWIRTTDGKWYYLNPNPSLGIEGAMIKTSWIDVGGCRYYLTDTGAMATGWCKINNKFYYFNPKEGGPQGALLRNTTIDSFYVGADGAWVENH